MRHNYIIDDRKSTYYIIMLHYNEDNILLHDKRQKQICMQVCLEIIICCFEYVNNGEKLLNS